MAMGLSIVDLKLGWRMLVRYPGLTFVGGLAIAFVVAAGAATFEIATQMLRPTLPLSEGDRIVGVRLWNVRRSEPDLRALHSFGQWREQLQSFVDLGAFRAIGHNLGRGNWPGEPADGAEITASAFRVARVLPLMGRTLIDADEAADAPSVVVIGFDIWQARFNSDAAVVGSEVRIGNTRHIVIGVMPKGFEFPVAQSFWIPMRVNPAAYGPGEGSDVHVFGRLAPGITVEAAQTELTTFGQRISTEFRAEYEFLRPQVVRYAQMFMNTGELSLIFYSMQGFVVMLLLLICANVGALIFARAETRSNEIVVRNALGASRRQIVTQLFIEALVLGVFAAVLGLAAAQFGLKWGMAAIEAYQETRLPFWVRDSVSPTAVLYVAALTVIGALIAGALPALKITGRDLQEKLRQGGTGGATVRVGRVWTGVIVAQVAITAGFMPILLDAVADLYEMRPPQVGYDVKDFLAIRLEMDREVAQGVSGDSTELLFRRKLRAASAEFVRRLSTEPGVIGVASATELPGGYHPRRLIEVEGEPLVMGDILTRQVQRADVDVQFFDVLGASVASGRAFFAADLSSAAPVVVVNQTFVDRFVSGRNPVGRRLRYLCTREGASCNEPDPEPGPWHEIVGVTSDLTLTMDPDIRHNAGVYHAAQPGDAYPVRIAVRIRAKSDSLVQRIRELALIVDPGLRVQRVEPLEDIRRHLWMEYTFWLRIALMAGSVLLLLSVMGIYSVVAFTVSRRTREIGIRVALGADPRHIATEVIRRALVQLAAGAFIGLVLILIVGGLPKNLRWTALLAAGLLFMVASGLLACMVPVRRALRIQPMEALRTDG